MTYAVAVPLPNPQAQFLRLNLLAPLIALGCAVKERRLVSRQFLWAEDTFFERTVPPVAVNLRSEDRGWPMTPDDSIRSLMQGLRSEAETIGRRAESADAYVVAEGIECELIDAWGQVCKQMLPAIGKALRSGELRARDERFGLPVGSDQWSESVVAIADLRGWGRSFDLTFDRAMSSQEHDSFAWLSRTGVLADCVSTPTDSERAAQVEDAEAEASESAIRAAGLSTSQIVRIFGNFYFRLENWSIRLQDPADWLRACKINLAKKRSDESRWDPLKLALGLRKALEGNQGPRPRRGSPAELNMVMVTEPQLRPWASEWRRLTSTFNYRAR